MYKTQPILLTLDQVRQLPRGVGEPVILETRYPIDTWDKGTLLQWRGSGYIHEEYLSTNRWFNPSSYNRTWRIWKGGVPKLWQQAEAAWEPVGP